MIAPVHLVGGASGVVLEDSVNKPLQLVDGLGTTTGAMLPTYRDFAG